MNIVIVSKSPIDEFVAIDDDTYDGPGSPVGYGFTKEEAIADLKEKLEEKGLV